MMTTNMLIDVEGHRSASRRALALCGALTLFAAACGRAPASAPAERSTAAPTSGTIADSRGATGAAETVGAPDAGATSMSPPQDGAEPAARPRAASDANRLESGPAADRLGAERLSEEMLAGEGSPADAEPGSMPPSTSGSTSSDAEVAPAAAPAEGACTLPPAPPLPPPGSGGPERWAAFREPLPPTPLWNPPGRKRVGLQAGHWLVEQAPEELRRLQHGTSGGGKQEWEVNLDLARRARALLEQAGIDVDLLPTAVPVRYRAHAFVSIHADGDPAGRASGFKVARPGFSSVPEHDDRLVDALNAAYGPATGLRRDDEHITLRMRYYYAFNSRRYCHAVAPGVPQAIVEAGFLTSAADRVLLLGNPDAAARGIANGVIAFLNGGPRR